MVLPACRIWLKENLFEKISFKQNQNKSLFNLTLNNWKFILAGKNDLGNMAWVKQCTTDCMIWETLFIILLVTAILIGVSYCHFPKQSNGIAYLQHQVTSGLEVILEIEGSIGRDIKRQFFPMKKCKSTPLFWASPIFIAYLHCFW